ncbi:MAG: AAA family ATPase [Myxococcales bacterium]
METILTSFEQHLQERGFECIETHLSRVFLGERDVYKLKRPVDLGFVDFTSLEARKRACEAEVELNRRLAPDVYLGVQCLSEGEDGAPRLSAITSSAPNREHEWLVHMRRLPDSARADTLLLRDELSEADVDRIATMLVNFHRGARCDAHTTEFGRPASIATNVEENFHQIERSVANYLSRDETAQLSSFQRRFLARHTVLLEQRCAQGRIRDGHGDLRLEHLYRQPDGSFIAIDCIEFNERFRYADVCSDLAFLVMDLDYHQRRDLAERLVLRYALESGDYALYRLLDFYVSYRALVRAKVTSMLASDPYVSSATSTRAASEARRYYLLALSAGCAPLDAPCVVAMAGGMASGKSTLAQALGEARALPVLTADRVRKELLGVPLTQPLHAAPFAGAYDASTSERVYDELLSRADHVLASGRSVVLDASFRSRALRQRALNLAQRHGVPALFVECSCSPEETQARFARRKQGPSISDGRAEIAANFEASFEPLSELSRLEHCQVDTERPLSENLAKILSHRSA